MRRAAGDEREQRLAERIGLALQDAEVVPADVGVLGGEDDEALVGECRAERVVQASCSRIDDHVRPAFQPVLADDHRPPFARLEILGQEQHAVGEHVGVDVEHDLVAGPLRLVDEFAGRGLAGRLGGSRLPMTSE